MHCVGFGLFNTYVFFHKTIFGQSKFGAGLVRLCTMHKPPSFLFGFPKVLLLLKQERHTCMCTNCLEIKIVPNQLYFAIQTGYHIQHVRNSSVFSF